MKSSVALFLLASLAPCCRAAVNYSFAPNPATISDAIRLRVDIHECFDAGVFIEVDHAARTVTAQVGGDDVPCDPNLPGNVVTPRFFAVGRLAAGTYTARVVACQEVLPPFTCSTLHEEVLPVHASSARASAIPALSTAGLAGLVLALAWVAARGARR